LISCGNGCLHVINHGVRVRWVLCLPILLCVASTASAGQSSTRGLTSGEAIFRAGCAGCHGPDGKGAPDTTVGFDKPATFPDFSDCGSTTPELDVDWKATIRQGGRGRGFSRIMPAFEEQLTDAQIDAVVGYLRTLCSDSRWPRGELNLPRPLATEKAFPESETAVTTAFDAHHAPDVSSELVYERRLGVRTQFEMSIPFGSVHDESGTVARGVGDVGFGMKQVLLASTRSILSAQGEMIVPTGNHAKGLGSGVTVFEAFAAYGQILPSRMFLQAQFGTEQPTSTEETPRAIFTRAALGTSFRQEAGIGRMWSPMLELITDRDLEDGAKTNVDIMPQMQVTINRRQHIRGSVGLQVPVANTSGRSKQIVFYLLWDWFDGGLLEGWR
jgi:mono/diheme cytochrome c family protein